MNAKIPETSVSKNLPENLPAKCGWLFYDGECSLCTGTALRFKSFLNRHGFEIVPLQSDWARECLEADKTPDEMKLLTGVGKIYGGADALIQIARRIWWTWPIFTLAQIPGVMSLIRWIYRHVAARRNCLNGVCRL